MLPLDLVYLELGLLFHVFQNTEQTVVDFLRVHVFYYLKKVIQDLLLGVWNLFLDGGQGSEEPVQEFVYLVVDLFFFADSLPDFIQISIFTLLFTIFLVFFNLLVFSQDFLVFHKNLLIYIDFVIIWKHLCMLTLQIRKFFYFNAFLKENYIF
jgi:hypothetical protein